MNLRPMVRDRDKGAIRHLVDVDDPARVALCGRPGPWSPTPNPGPRGSEAIVKRCEDCATSHQRQTNHVGGRVWAGV